MGIEEKTLISRKNKQKLGKFTFRKKVLFAVVGAFLFLYSLTYLFTLGWALLSSIRDKLEFIRDPLSWPKKWDFENYIDAFNVLEVGGNNLFAMIFNSLWYSIGGTLISVFFCNVTGYCVCKYRFVGKNTFYNVAILTMLVPVVGAMPATYRLLDTIGMVNTPLYLIVMAGGMGFNFLLFYGFYSNVSWEYAEAVFIDGGGHFTVFLRVMLPQSLPMCFALGIVSFIGLWNDYNSTLLYLPDFPTLATGLYLFQFVPSIRADYPLYFAAIIIATIPVVVLYACFQETIMTNTVAGGLKG